MTDTNEVEAVIADLCKIAEPLTPDGEIFRTIYWAVDVLQRLPAEIRAREEAERERDAEKGRWQRCKDLSKQGWSALFAARAFLDVGLPADIAEAKHNIELAQGSFADALVESEMRAEAALARATAAEQRAEEAERRLAVYDSEFAAVYTHALASGKINDVVRALSGRLREMDKRAKAANTRADAAEARATAQEQRIKVLEEALAAERERAASLCDRLAEEADEATKKLPVGPEAEASGGYACAMRDAAAAIRARSTQEKSND